MFHFPGHVVTSVSAVLELEALCICTAEGALLLLRTSSQEVEQVGHFQGGIAAAAWSPDGAVLLILTALGSLLLMNQVRLLPRPLSLYWPLSCPAAVTPAMRNCALLCNPGSFSSTLQVAQS